MVAPKAKEISGDKDAFGGQVCAGGVRVESQFPSGPEGNDVVLAGGAAECADRGQERLAPWGLGRPQWVFACEGLGCDVVYYEFLAGGQYTARTEDERVRAAQLINSGGPEMRAAGRIALESPPQLLHSFIESGQYTAQRKDLLATTHKARVQQLIAEAARTAATAQQNAAEARRVAALAHHKDDEAKKYAKQAQASADEAKNSAADAAKSAKDAEASAARAAESAKTARKAAADADHAASNAATSAADAAVSAQLAHVSANTAWAEARRARASATAAGKDATAARKAAGDAFDIAVDKFKAEAEAQRKAEAEAKKKASKDPGKIAREQYMCGVMGCDAAHNFPSWCIRNEGYCTILAAGTKLEPGLEKIWKFEKDLIGIGMLQECVHTGDFDSCTQLARDAAFGSKLKLLSRAYDALRQLDRGCTQCFLAGTKVLLGNASARNIEDIKVGERVRATDPKTGKTSARRVTRVIVTENDKHFNELKVATKSGPKKVTATYEHPFWSPSVHRWVKAHEIKAGASLLSDDGSSVRVLANRSFDKQARTYNLTVASVHTYYVMAGDTSLLVHNSGPGCGSNWISSGRLPHHYMRKNNQGVPHAKEFGVDGPYNRQNGAKFAQAVERLVKNPGTRKIEGTFRGQLAVHYVDTTGLHASFAASGPNVGEYLGGWRSQGDQLTYLLRDGVL
ncbi:polymorphic toxin-type HINT domain-containing protein [Streptomyces sp. NPDC048595]|uniref:polymorphic toxin-type HINT domain-containing protein n=1 Tax=Streptomyces sp. NPDC048595 TaxID=3365576 RepID=UPI00370F771C